MCTTLSWWRHQMETFSALLAICAGNSPVPGEFTAQRPVTRSFDVFFDLRLNKPLSKQWWGWWLETLSRPLWRHCNDVVLFCGGGDATISCQWNHTIHLPIFSGLLQNRPLPYPVYDIVQNHYSCNGLPIAEGCVFRWSGNEKSNFYRCCVWWPTKHNKAWTMSMTFENSTSVAEL